MARPRCLHDPGDPTAEPDCPRRATSTASRSTPGWWPTSAAGRPPRAQVRDQRDQLWGSTAYDAYQRQDVPPPDFVRLGQGTDDTTGTSGGVYAQDRWTLGKLTVSGGIRFDFQTVSLSGTSGKFTDVGVSPRLGVAYAFTPNLVAHAFFGLLWTPPEALDAVAAARLSNAVPAGQPVPYDLRPEKDRYAEVGLQARLSRAVSVGVNVWGKLATDQLDEVEFGNTTISSPYNFAEGRAGASS